MTTEEKYCSILGKIEQRAKDFFKYPGSAYAEYKPRLDQAYKGITEDKAKIELERCIGCGVCVYHCPAEAITLVSRADFVEPPKSFRELIEKQAAAKTKS